MRVVCVSLCAVVIIGLVIPAMSNMFSPGYADSWAVEVEGGEEVAKALAMKHGFEFMGQVGNLKNMYHFKLPNNNREHSPHKTADLEAEDAVGFVEQQYYRKMSKKLP